MWLAGVLIISLLIPTRGFPGGSEGKESACNVGHPSMIPGSGRSPGEGNGNPLQYSCLENSWTEEPGGLQPMGLQRVGHNWATSLHFKSVVNVLISQDSFCFPKLHVTFINYPDFNRILPWALTIYRPGQPPPQLRFNQGSLTPSTCPRTQCHSSAVRSQRVHLPWK